MQFPLRAAALAAAIAVGVTAHVLADTVTLKNGDKITGTVGQIADNKMSFKSPVLGDITIDMANVESYATDAPIDIRLKDGASTQGVAGPTTSGTAEKVETAGGGAVAM